MSNKLLFYLLKILNIYISIKTWARQEEDDQGVTGINLSKELPAAAARALQENLLAFAPAVLPASELLRVAFSSLRCKFLGKAAKRYRPAFRRAFQHFCIHPGGRRVLDEVQRGLGLSDGDMEASRMTLHRFGNMASSSLLYELAYIEAKGRMRRGDRVWQIGFGSGFKCNSAVWKCLRTIKTPTNGPWDDCIHRYPVDIPEVVKL